MKKAIGQVDHQRHLDGERLTPMQMARAKCYDCMGGYADGRVDCIIPICPLYPLMPYRKGGVEKRKSMPGKKPPIRKRVDA